MTTTSVKILHVEDDPRRRSAMKALLERHGFQVITAESGLDALRLLSDGSLEIVLLDYDLPDMTGAQLAQEIREIRPATPNILLSGRPFLPPSELAHVDAFLVKRSPIDELFCTIASLAEVPAITPMLEVLNDDSDQRTLDCEWSSKFAELHVSRRKEQS